MTSSSQYSISVQHLTKYYGNKLGVSDVTFNVAPGEIVGFLGPNGSGKTTVLRMLMGLIRPSSGRAQIFGNEIRSNSWEDRSQIGYLPGILGLYKDMTVIEYFTFISNIRNHDCSQRMKELMDRFALSPTAMISGLSKGTKQKVGVIQSLMHSPKILILDEPTSGLDPIVQQEFVSIIREERDKGASILLSSHVMNEVDELADRVIILMNGQVVIVDSIEALKSRTERNLRMEFPSEVPATIFMGIPGVDSVRVDGRFVYCTATGPQTALLKAAVAWNVLNVVSEETSLNEIFLVQTGNNNGA